MVFSSTLFLFMFFPVSLLGYFLIRNKYKNYWLLLVSLIFFTWSQPNYLWIILLNIAINYTGALLIDKLPKARKAILTIAVMANLLLLFYFKYFDFALASINMFMGTQIELRNIILPIGISFFTFQGMSYVIDVYRKDVSVSKNIFHVALYIVLFPQLIAGPIVRYNDIATEISRRTTTLQGFCKGIERFIIGLAKKAIIANTMAVVVDSIWNNGAGNNDWIIAWIGSIAYTLQIYFDFSGYSDMAIGLGRMFGFHFNENFNLPYISTNISEFWRRWHISLSSWFRDYVYIPLGGNKKNVYLNLAVVFLLTGIWHGAAWNFIAWGVWNGIFILLERFIRNNIRGNSWGGVERNIIERIILKAYTLFVVNIGWVMFRTPDVMSAVKFLGSMFGLITPKYVPYTVFWYLDHWTLFIMLIAIFAASSLPSRICTYGKSLHLNEAVVTIVRYVLLLLLFYLSMIRIVSGTYNPFIYFQF